MNDKPASHSRATVLLVDDHRDLLTNLAAWLADEGFNCLTATDGAAALAILHSEKVDVVVTDLEMPGMHGLQLVTNIHALDNRIQIIVLTGRATLESAIATLRHGHAFDFLQKPLKDLKVLRSTIEQALSQVRTTSPTCVSILDRLTDREREVLTSLARGLDNREIAEQLCLSEKTVRNHLSRVYEKLKVTSRAQAIILVQQLTSPHQDR